MGRFLQFRYKDIRQEWWCQSFYEWLCTNGARKDFAQHITFCLGLESNAWHTIECPHLICTTHTITYPTPFPSHMIDLQCCNSNAAECLNIYLPDLFNTTSFTACKVGDAVPLPNFAPSKESGTNFNAGASTAKPEAIKALITNGSIFEYANDLSQVQSYEV